MNILCGILIIILCIFIGYMMSSKYTDKKIFYYNFSNFNNKLIKEVGFSKKTISQIINELNDNTDFYKQMVNVIINKKEFDFSCKYLTEDEKKYFTTYMLNIGKTDSTSESKFIEDVKENIDKKYKICEEDEKKYKKLYIKVWFFIGLMMLIILL